MDTATLSDRLEEYWNDWHLDFDAQMINNRRHRSKVEDPLSGVDENAERVVEVFDEWHPSQNTNMTQELDALEARWKIGSAAFVEGGYERDKDYTWTPYTMRSCIKSRINSIMELTGKKDFSIGDVYALIRDCFVRSMKYRGVELDESIEKKNGLIDVSSVVTLEEGIEVSDEQEELIWNNLAIITYGFLAQANRIMVNVPFTDDDVAIDTDRQNLPFSGGLKEYVQAWSSGMAPDIRQGDGHLWAYAKYNNRVVGFSSGYIGDDSRQYDWVKVGGLVVNCNYQRRGLGQRLLQRFEQSMPEHVQRLRADAVKSSLPFWLSQGFKDKGASWDYANCRQIEKVIREKS